MRVAPLSVAGTLLQHALLGLESLFYLQSTAFVAAAVDVALTCNVVCHDTALLQMAGQLLVRMMSFPEARVRVAAYQQLRGVVNAEQRAMVFKSTHFLQSELLLSYLVLGA
jgi:hypothetical protein